MKKATYFITPAATKYWKKEIKNGRLHIATKGDRIYILNGYNAFIIPNVPEVFADLVQPATLRPAPEDGKAYKWIGGIFYEESADYTTDLIDRILTAETAGVTRTRWTVEDSSGRTCRIYRRERGDLIGFNTDYDNMVNWEFEPVGTMAANKAAAVWRYGEFVALLMPVYLDRLEEWAKELGV